MFRLVATGRAHYAGSLGNWRRPAPGGWQEDRMAATAFDVRETHGILMRSENRMRVSCDGHGWSSLYASAQREQPYEGHFPPVRDQLLVLHRNGPVAVERLDDGRPQRHVVPAGGVHLFPGGRPFNVRLMGELDTVHVYI